MVIFENQKTVDIRDLAARLNMAYNMGNIQTVLALAETLFNEVRPRKQGGQALIKLSSNECQCVGLAFTIIALNLDFGDEDANSVAAENAYYCLARCYIDNKNTFSLPAIFTILNNRPNLLKDKLIASWCTMAQNQTGIPIGMMLGGNPYTDPRLKDFRNQAIGFASDIKYFALSHFYDISNNKYLVPTDLPYFIPNQSDIKSLISIINKKTDYSSTGFLAKCEEHFVSVYEECRKTLAQF